MSIGDLTFLIIILKQNKTGMTSHKMRLKDLEKDILVLGELKQCKNNQCLELYVNHF